ncbi:MAG: aminotransferase class IV [Leptospiraceae bacterium]|nr:aminotransferase class IV [Leptospiraceae bacterium]MDW8306873.1 aminotransferase class IV [Leptospiraceae bacterium]
MSLFLETIRFENYQAPLLAWHEQRLNETIRAHYGNAGYISLAKLHPPDGRLYKCRVTYSSRIEKAEFTLYEERRIESLRLVFCDSIRYNYKYADRGELDRLYDERRGCDDVLIVRQGLVTDTSFANILFYKEGRWFTPAQPLLAGVQRAFLISLGKIIPMPISWREIKQFQRFMLINAMLPFDFSRSQGIDRIEFS